MERNNKKRLLAFIPYLALTALAVLGIINIKWLINVLAGLWNILSPLVIGCAMAYVLNLIMRKLEKLYFPKSEKRIVQATKRPVCLVLSLLLVFILLGLVMGLIVPEIVNIFVVMGETLPVYGEKIRKLLMEYDSQLPVVGDYIEEYLRNGGIDWNTILAKAVEFAKNGVGGLLTSTISVVASVVGGVVNFFIGLIFAIYILYNKENNEPQRLDGVNHQYHKRSDYSAYVCAHNGDKRCCADKRSYGAGVWYPEYRHAQCAENSKYDSFRALTNYKA